MAQFVPLKIDTKGDDWKKWARTYKTEGSSIPIIYVVRADGEQLYGKSGAKKGEELPTFMREQLLKSGHIFSDGQISLLSSILAETKKALDDGNTFQAIQTLSAIQKKKIGTPGSLGSYAEAAVELDALVKTLTDRGKAELATAQEGLATDEPSFDDMLAMAEVKRVYSLLPSLKSDILQAVRLVKKKPKLRDMLKQAESIDRAASVALKSGGKSRAVKSLERLAGLKPGSPASKAALAKIEEITGEPAPEVGAAVESVRTWSDNTGKFKLQATLISNTGGTVRLEKEDGKVISLPFAKLSKSDQRYLSQR